MMLKSDELRHDFFHCRGSKVSDLDPHMEVAQIRYFGLGKRAKLGRSDGCRKVP